MKKFISVFLAALMLMTCFSVVAFAEFDHSRCNCAENGTHNPNGSCHCCIYCENLDGTYVTACVQPSLTKNEPEFCCGNCTGIVGCTCGCECCKLKSEDVNDGNNKLDDYVTEQDKENFVDGFQAILKKVSDFFDMIFDAIFEFLRFDEVLGK